MENQKKINHVETQLQAGRISIKRFKNKSKVVPVIKLSTTPSRCMEE
jgi:hypothetical protein